MIPDQILAGLIDEGVRWLLEQRERFLEQARPLGPEERRVMGPFFEEETLCLTRVAWAECLEEPAFLNRLRAQGVPMLLDFRRAAGITFVDTIVVVGAGRPGPGSVSPGPSLLFHELVHVAQYRLLGPERLIRQYVDGWINNGLDYFRIPIEVEAYELERAFCRGDPPFSVEDYLRERGYGSEEPASTVES